MDTVLVAVGYEEQDDPTRCGSRSCGCELNPSDHVVMFTTRHVRRFCSVNCLSDANDAYWAEFMKAV